MATAAQTHSVGGFARSTGSWPAIRTEGVRAATVVAAAAFTLLVGHDGTTGWQVARAMAVALFSGAVLFGEARSGDRARGLLAAGIGIVVLAVGGGYLPFVAKDPSSLEAVAGSAAALSGLFLTAAGVVIGTRGRARLHRVAAGILTVFVALLVVSVLGVAVAGTNVPRPAIGESPAGRGLAYESVTLSTDDGVALAGWYVASTNRAAVVLLHGAGSTRSNVLDEAAVLAGHGFGVLMVDARGHGDSGGRAMDFGWHGDADIAAAVRFLAARPDVDRERIGAVGLSMGGEEAIGATATNPIIRAVVAEGATGRTAGDAAWLSDDFGLRGMFQEQVERVQDRVTDLLTSASVPTSLRAAVEAGRARYLMITAGDVTDEGRAAAYIAAAALDRAETWSITGAGHTAGLGTAAVEWERRVIGFLSGVLAVPEQR